MASITPRKWRTRAGEPRSAWAVSYLDKAGKQHRHQYATKREAIAERIRVEGALSQGTYVPDGITVREAAESFLACFRDLYKNDKKERSTYRAYEQHVRLHISKRDIANVTLARLTGADCAKFAQELNRDLSGAMALRVFGTFKTILGYSRRNEWILVDRVDGIKVERGHRPRVKIPSKLDLMRLLAGARKYDEQAREAKNEKTEKNKAEAFILLLLFGGLRASEQLGLRRSNVDVDGRCVTVNQRADRWRKIGRVKTDTSERTIPLPAKAIAAIATWRSQAPRSDQDLLFPNGKGNVDFYQNVYRRLWLPVMLLAGLAKKTTRVDGQGREKVEIEPQFGMHALRHAAVSLWIEQGANLLQVRKWAGHSSAKFTLDVYGHLWTNPVWDARIVEGAAQSLTEDISPPSDPE
jgi:integrase